MTRMTFLHRLFPATVDLAVEEAMDAGWSIDSPDAYCHRCGASIGPGLDPEARCPHCKKQSIPWQGTVRLAGYDETTGAWIKAMKFAGRWTWARWFGRQLTERIKAAGPIAEQTVICPVPMAFGRRWKRGFNQAQLIAGAVAKGIDRPMVSLLDRTRYTPPQTSVAPSKRYDNIANSIAMKPIDLTGWRVWLVDDVKTTGATLTACARRLKAAGAQRVSVAVAAVADPKHADFKAV